MGEEKIIRYPQLAKEPLIVGHKTPNLNNRLWAKGIDCVLILAGTTLCHWIWAPSLLPVAVFFWGRVDGAGRGQSPGKWLLGLHTIESHRGKKLAFYNSLVRNLPFLLITVGLLWSSPWGWALCGLGVSCALIELYFVSKLRTGIRVGDVIGRTRVFDYKDEHTLFIERFLKEEQV